MPSQTCTITNEEEDNEEYEEIDAEENLQDKKDQIGEEDI